MSEHFILNCQEERNGLKREDYYENSSSNKQKINYLENFLQIGNVYFIFKENIANLLYEDIL